MDICIRGKSRASKIFLLFIAFFVMLAVIQPVRAYAADKEYSVDYAEFEVEYDENSGDALVTEKWDVTYIKGDFTRFYKDIYNPDNQLEHFDDVKVISCSINGNEATATNSIDRVDYHYFFEENSSANTDTIHWFLHASGETVRYEIKYRIVNAVKLDKDDRAVFCYRFRGEKFSKTIGATKVIVHIPVMDDETIAVNSDGGYRFDGNTLIGEAENVSDVLKYRISMSKDGFSNLQRIIDVQVSDEAESDNNKNKMNIGDLISWIIVGIVFGGIFVLYPVYMLIRTIARKIYITAALKKNPNCFKDAADRLENSKLPFMWYIALATPNMFASQPFMIFYAELFELCNKKRIAVRETEIHILRNSDYTVWDEKADNADAEFLNLMLRYFTVSMNVSGFSVITFDTIKSTLSIPAKCAEFMNELKKWALKYKKQLSEMPQYKNIKGSSEIKQIKADLNFWKRYAKSAKLSTDIYQCMGVAQRTESISSYMVLQLMNAYKRTPKLSNIDNEMYTFCDFMDYDARPYSSSSDGSGGGCSSCSSCSSCSGCGGGGAD